MLTLRCTAKIVPMLTFTSMFEEPSRGSNAMAYGPVGNSGGIGMASSISSEAMMQKWPEWSSAAMHDVVGEVVELLHLLALHVLLARQAEDLDEGRLVDLARDDLRRERDLAEDARTARPSPQGAHAGARRCGG